MIDSALCKEAESFLEDCRIRNIKVATAESCTGGLIAAALTSIPGSADVLERGFITYCNTAKIDMLGVPEILLKKHGAVSTEVAEAMVMGALKNSTADLALSVTGIAGPGGATAEKPIGLVYIASAKRHHQPLSRRFLFSGDRAAVRSASVRAALELGREVIRGKAEV